MSYSEYLDNGIFSTAVPHFLSTASLLYGFGLSSRIRQEESVRRLVQHLSIMCRLHNDLHSVEKERQEGTLANAVLLIERGLPAEPARAFVAEELQGYRRLMKVDAMVSAIRFRG